MFFFKTEFENFDLLPNLVMLYILPHFELSLKFNLLLYMVMHYSTFYIYW